jgi:hypothetical protein
MTDWKRRRTILMWAAVAILAVVILPLILFF